MLVWVKNECPWDNFGGYFGAILVIVAVRASIWSKKVRKIGDVAQKVNLLTNLGCHFGAIWSHAGTLRAKVATQTPKKGVLREVQNQDPKKVDFGTSRDGVRRVHSHTIAQFLLFRPGPFWLQFWIYFGIDLETQIPTILLLGRRW